MRSESDGQPDVRPKEILVQVDRLVTEINRLSTAIEALHPNKTELARSLKVDHEQEVNPSEMADEETVAGILGISKRTLGEHRRKGKFPGCWIKNGRQISWKIKNTMDAWRAGIS